MAKTLFEILFWLSVAWIAFAWIGYPLFTIAASAVVRRRVGASAPVVDSPLEPTVSLLIAAYNEERDIVAKLDNCLTLDYPRAKLEIVVASDGSTDRTDELVQRFAETSAVPVRLHRVEGRVGKTETQNRAVRVCQGDVIVFSDAASLYERGALRALVAPFADPQVGAVSGRCEYVVQREAPVGLGARIFWALENLVKSRQSRMGTLTGATGCIYSVRRDVYAPLPREIVSDLVEPIMVLRQGYRVVFAPDAIAWEETAGRSRQEFRMRVRVVVGGVWGLGWALRRLDPRRHALAWAQLVAHKVTRWLVPLFALTALVASAVLAPVSAVYLAALALQVGFYLAAVAGALAERAGLRGKGILYFPLWLCLTNAASLVAMVRVAQRRNIVVWSPVRAAVASA